MDWLSVVGSIASIAAALWAWYEAIRSRRFANDAEKIRSQIVSQRKTSELSELRPLVSNALEHIKPYSTTMASSLIGVDKADREKHAAHVQTLLNKIFELEEYFSAGFSRDFYDTTHASLQSFLSAETADDLKKFGMQLNRQIVDFSSVLRKLLNERRESV